MLQTVEIFIITFMIQMHTRLKLSSERNRVAVYPPVETEITDIQISFFLLTLLQSFYC